MPKNYAPTIKNLNDTYDTYDTYDTFCLRFRLLPKTKISLGCSSVINSGVVLFIKVS